MGTETVINKLAKRCEDLAAKNAELLNENRSLQSRIAELEGLTNGPDYEQIARNAGWSKLPISWTASFVYIHPDFATVFPFASWQELCDYFEIA